MLTLQDRVMGTEEVSARLCEQVADRRRNSPPLRTSASVRTFSVFRRVGFFLQLVSELVALLAELGGKVKVLEQDLEMVKAMFGQNAEALARSHEE